MLDWFYVEHGVQGIDLFLYVPLIGDIRGKIVGCCSRGSEVLGMVLKQSADRIVVLKSRSASGDGDKTGAVRGIEFVTRRKRCPRTSGATSWAGVVPNLRRGRILVNVGVLCRSSAKF